ncbi:MAG: RNA 2'-phosphotransferase [Nocardioidaceae bacterium]
MDRADIKRSKRLAAVLRHRPESIGIELDRHGWVDVDRLLSALGAHGSPMTRQDLDRVVTDNDKAAVRVGHRHRPDPSASRAHRQCGPWPRASDSS